MIANSDNETRSHCPYQRSINRFPVLGEEEEAELVRQWQKDQDPAAKEKLITSHLRLVPSIARRTAEKLGFEPPADSPKEAWEGYSNVCDELVLAGNEGLLQALARYDPSRGPRFSVCARYFDQESVLGRSDIATQSGEASEVEAHALERLS